MSFYLPVASALMDEVDLGNARYSLVVALTCFLYDHALNFAEEMEFVWSRKFNWATLAYLFMKVVTPAMLVGGLGVMSLVDVSNQMCCYRAVQCRGFSHRDNMWRRTIDAPVRTSMQHASSQGGYSSSIYAFTLRSPSSILPSASFFYQGYTTLRMGRR
ncbi:hypothetical protein EXIGLDRAFT_278345 [Exidia glandulosa HHB12029]|uniref:DUF6533 domain-containing protein n=1 Tax=Exidia glandulosa HHB12029 TaxID=1314781 RepID=A0A165DKP7_EXIGL|nr:hypothetical protein EXIGLDRAFT_278345 [Exidia glandulosa HHB12029]